MARLSLPRKCNLTSQADVVAFFTAMVNVVGLAFHVDTRAADYRAAGKPVFPPGVAKRIDGLMEKAFSLQTRGVVPDLYATAVAVMTDQINTAMEGV